MHSWDKQRKRGPSSGAGGAGLARRRALKGQPLRLDSVTAGLEQSKAGLIENAILPIKGQL
jgi:hypothetical protein